MHDAVGDTGGFPDITMGDKTLRNSVTLKQALGIRDNLGILGHMTNQPLSFESSQPSPQPRRQLSAVPGKFKETEDLFRLLVGSVKDYAIFVLDPDGHVMTWNEGAQRINGYDADEIVGKHFSIFYPQEARDVHHPEHELEIAIAEGRYEEEGWRLRKDGTAFWANVVITALYENGELIGFGKVTRDLTERKRLKHERDQNEHLFRLFVNSVRDYALFMLDPQGNIMTWNEGAQRIKGYTAEEIIGKHISTFYTQEAKDRKHAQHELAVAKAEGRYEEEGWRVRKDGSMFWASVIITAVYNNGDFIGFSKVTRDLTERKVLEQQREEHAQALGESNEELQRLAYVVSHELQPPISTISRYGNLLTVRYKDRLGDDANEFIGKITGASRLVARMVDDLWTYARITKPHQTDEQVWMESALSEALAELRHSEEFKDKISDATVTHGTLPRIWGDREQLVFVLKELVRNAVRYRGAEEPRVRIEAESDRDGFLFTVRDNGKGIDPVLIPEVFKVFHRLEGGPEPHASGAGLSIVRRIVLRHRGTIKLESQRGVGTTVKLWLPNEQ